MNGASGKSAIKIPYTRRKLSAGEKHKPLRFLVDIGFLSLFVRWGGTCLMDRVPYR